MNFNSLPTSIPTDILFFHEAGHSVIMDKDENGNFVVFDPEGDVEESRVLTNDELKRLRQYANDLKSLFLDSAG